MVWELSLLADKEITFELKTPEIFILLLFLGLVLFLELQVSFQSPISFGDEGFHTRISRWIGENVEYPVWVPFYQTGIAKRSYERQPYWNMLEASFFYLIGFNEAIVKFLVPMISLMTGIIVFLFAKTFYNSRVGLLASVMLVTLPSFVTYAVLFYTDALMTFFMIMFVYTFCLSLKTERRIYMLAAGTFGALAFMTKLTGYLVYMFVGVIFLYYFYKERKFLSLIKKYSPMFLLLIIIPSTMFIRSYTYYNTPMCYRLPFVSVITDVFFSFEGCRDIDPDFEPQLEYSGRTEGGGTETDVFTMGVMNYLAFAYGNVWFFIFPLLAGLFLMTNKPNDIDMVVLVILFLYLLPFLGTTSRAEDTSRYALTWAPLICIVAAKYFESIYDFIKRYQRHIALIVFLFVMYFGYQSVVSKLSVMVQVKQFSPSFFEACDWVQENTPIETRLSTLWTHRTAYSCNRYVTDNPADIGLGNNATDMKSLAEKIGITHIFIQKFSIDPQNRHLQERYDASFVQLLENNPEHFDKVFENGPSLDQCLQQGACDGNIIYEIVY